MSICHDTFSVQIDSGSTACRSAILVERFWAEFQGRVERRIVKNVSVLEEREERG
jgi:hypothetical protein